MRNYIKTPLNNVLTIDNLVSLHYFEYALHFKGQGESHDFWEMVYVDCGMIEVTADNEKCYLKQGQAIFHPPGEYHNIYSFRDFTNVFIISFYNHQLEEKFFRGTVFRLDDRDRDLIAEILSESRKLFSDPLDIMDQTKLHKREDAPFGCEQFLRAAVERLLISILRNRTVVDEDKKISRLVKTNNEQYIVDSILSLLNENLYGHVTLDALCKKVSFSRSYMEKLFKKNTGFSILNYFNKLKIDEAKRMISEGKYSVTEISQALNFSSIHYFSRVFKTFAKMSPSEYDKSVKLRGLL